MNKQLTNNSTKERKFMPYKGIVKDNVIVLEGNVKLPERTRVEVIPESEKQALNSELSGIGDYLDRLVEYEEKLERLTARGLIRSGLIGLWKDRKDIGDSADYARQLRQQAQKRRG
jgi:hypothetical protein